MVMQRRHSRHRGFALIDAIIGGIILSIGLGFALSVASRALSAQGVGERQMVSSWLAEELLAMVVVEGPLAYPTLHDTAGRFDAPFEDYYFELDIEERGMGEPYLVSAYVSWADGAGIIVQTLVAAKLDEEPEVREPIEPLDRETRHLENDPDYR
jgi:hypothetical protein